MEVTRRSLIQATVAVSAVLAAGSTLGIDNPPQVLAEDEEKSLTDVEFEEVQFGVYPQYMLGEDAVAPITWLVLSEKGSMKLLLSKYCLSARPYDAVTDANYRDVTWGECTLRSWLNEEFLQTAFSDDERSRICSSLLSADANPEFGTDGGSATEDKVFVPSLSEIAEAIGSDGADVLSARATGLASREGAYCIGTDRRCAWWLRTPGSRGMYALQVLPNGTVDVAGEDVTSCSVGVRPALLLRF